MPIYTVETPRGKRLKIESDSSTEAQRLADQWDLEDHAVGEAKRLGVNPDLILRQMHKESGARADAKSGKGAYGPMQLMPGTAKELGVDANDPYQNITGGVTYMRRQLDSFGGDEEKALAAYNAGPGNVRKYGGVPPFKETQDYVAELANKSPPQPPIPVARAAPPPPTPSMGSGMLGFWRGVQPVADKINDYSPAQLIPGFRERERAGRAAMAAKANASEGAGVKPNPLTRFGGNVLATSWLPGGPVKALEPLVMGGLSGALLSERKDAKGIIGDAALGAAAGKAGDLAFSAAGTYLPGLLSVPQKISKADLDRMVSEAYAKVDASGFAFPKADIGALADDFARTVGGTALSKTAKDDAASIIGYTRRLATGDLPLTQLERLRGDIYEAMVKKGGDAGRIGQQFRAKIDALIDAVPNGDVREARRLATQKAKYGAVSKRLDSADLQARRAYTGNNVDNAIRQKMSPLLDPLHSAQLRNATSDERAALNRVVDGSGGRNVLRLAGSLLDPRKLLGMGLQGSLGVGTGWTTNLLTVPAGMASTAISNRMAQKSVRDLLDLIAAGGSKSARVKVQGAASKAVKRTADVGQAVAPVAAGILAARRPDLKERR